MAVDSNQMLKSPKIKEASNQKHPNSSSAKRNKSPGIRLVGGRIYDSVNGKTCHQCRQKTRDFAASCTNQRNNKPCPIMYCHKCLLNRYGEKAEEVDASGDWSCPKCKGICNCSICMKKRGHQPTGILIKTAKATGFSSVSEMLLNGALNKKCENVVPLTAVSPMKELEPSPRKRGKENSIDGKVDDNLPNDSIQKSKKVKKVHKGDKDGGTPISESPDNRISEQKANLPNDSIKKSKKVKKVHKGNKDDGTPISESPDNRISEQIANLPNDSIKKSKKVKKVKGNKDDGTLIGESPDNRILEQKADLPNDSIKKSKKVKKVHKVNKDDGTLISEGPDNRILEQIANLPNDSIKKSKKVKKVHKGNKDDGTPISESPDNRILEQIANLPNDSIKKSKKVKKVKGNKDDGTLISESPDNRILEQKVLVAVQDCSKKLSAEDAALCGAEKSKKKKRDRKDDVESKKVNDETLKGKSLHDKKKQKHDHDSKSDSTLARRTSPRKLAASSRISNQEARPNVGVDDGSVKTLVDDALKEEEINTANALVGLKQDNAVFSPEILLPLGTELNTVARIDVSKEDVGNALQFLEFCAAFGKVLDVKKGQPEHVLQDLFHGRTGRRGKFSLTVQFQIHLLSVLLKEQGEEHEDLSTSIGKSSWFDALKECLSESQSILKAQGLDCLEKVSDYESLEASQKLSLLNFLCDEILGTEKLRSWMDKQNTELAEKVKEAKQKVSSAKEEEKTLKQTMKDDLAKAIIAKQGEPLSISEHDAIVSRIKLKAAEAHAKVVLESNGLLLENSRTCNAIRVEPVLVSCGGNAYWKLSSSGHSNILHQDVGKGDTLTFNDKWFAIDDEGKEAVEKHIASLRMKKPRF